MALARTYLLALVEGRTPLQGRWSHLLDVEVESVSPTPVFQSVSEEIKWLQLDADLGCIKAQHRLGLLYFESACGIDDLYLAYKWLFEPPLVFRRLVGLS